jgi:hypothetical protein
VHTRCVFHHDEFLYLATFELVFRDRRTRILKQCGLERRFHPGARHEPRATDRPMRSLYMAMTLSTALESRTPLSTSNDSRASARSA